MSQRPPHDRSGGSDSGNDDAPPTAAELAAAQRLARLVDGALAGAHAPPALDAEDRALLETATVVHATLGQAGLAPARVHALIDAALDPARAPARPVTPLPARPHDAGAARPRRFAALAAGAVALVAAAAALLIVLRRPAPPLAAQARSMDAIIGRPIAPDAADAASARLDALLADRRGGRP